MSGRTLQTDVFPGSQIADADFAAPAPTGAVGGAVSARPHGQRPRASRSRSTRSTAASRCVATGDRVDIYQQLASGGSEVIKLVRADVPVLQNDGSRQRRPAACKSIDVADVLYASKHTELFFVVRPTSGAKPTVPRTGEQRDDAPLRPDALTVARTIRALVALDEGLTPERVAAVPAAGRRHRRRRRRRGPQGGDDRPREHAGRHRRRRLGGLLRPGALLHRERRARLEPKRPIVVLTEGSTNGFVARVFEFGADDLLILPAAARRGRLRPPQGDRAPAHRATRTERRPTARR